MMERRDFLRGAAVLGAGLAIGQADVRPASAGRRIRWGALCNPRGDQKNMEEATKALQRAVGRNFATTHFRTAWDRDLVNDFTRWSVRSGHIPILSWNTFLSGGGMVSWRAIANGQHDDRIRTQARALHRAGWSGYLCFHHEPENDGNAADWKAAHDRVYGIFRHERARFRFVPTLMAYTYKGGYGGAKVWIPPRYDLLGVDGYNRADGATGWRSFHDIVAPAHHFARRRGKGLYVIEYGSTEGAPGAKAHWIHGARETMKRLNNIVGCSYNHENTDHVYWVDTSASSLRAFRRMGHDPAF
jgi:TAT (twin-arginine translocation) pathway signal sequence